MAGSFDTRANTTTCPDRSRASIAAGHGRWRPARCSSHRTSCVTVAHFAGVRAQHPAQLLRSLSRFNGRTQKALRMFFSQRSAISGWLADQSAAIRSGPALSVHLHESAVQRSHERRGRPAHKRVGPHSSPHLRPPSRGRYDFEPCKSCSGMRRLHDDDLCARAQRGGLGVRVRSTGCDGRALVSASGCGQPRHGPAPVFISNDSRHGSCASVRCRLQAFASNRPQRITGFAANMASRRVRCTQCFIFQPLDAHFNEVIPALASMVCRNAEPRCIRFAEDQIHIRELHIFGQFFFQRWRIAPGLTRGLQPGCQAGRRDARALISRTFEQDCRHSRPRWLQHGLAVYSVRSSALESRQSRRNFRWRNSHEEMPASRCRTDALYYCLVFAEKPSSSFSLHRGFGCRVALRMKQMQAQIVAEFKVTLGKDFDIVAEAPSTRRAKSIPWRQITPASWQRCEAPYRRFGFRSRVCDIQYRMTTDQAEAPRTEGHIRTNFYSQGSGSSGSSGIRCRKDR